jgi:hypothetical protein
MKCLPWAVVWVAVLALAGCATDPAARTPAPTGDPVLDGQSAIQSGPEKDRVLWQYRTALALMRRGQLAEAKPLLDAALTRISNVLGQDPTARRARGYFSPEAKKTFIGEPYERALAWFYRGILYWRDGEPDNARACFRSAAFEDSDTVDKQYASDYVLFDYLDGLASTKLSGDGSDALQRAQASARLSQPPPYDREANVLLFGDFGPGPTKVAGGRHGEVLLFRAGSTPVRSMQIRVAGKTYLLRPFDDLYFQATTRGGRVMDQVLANKAGFKDATSAVGDMGLITGSVLATQNDTQAAGFGLMLFGLVSKMTSAATTPQADTRSWDNLPLHLTFAAFKLPPGPHTATVDFLDDGGRPLAGMTKQVSFTVPPGSRDAVLYISEKSSTPLVL